MNTDIFERARSSTVNTSKTKGLFNHTCWERGDIEMYSILKYLYEEEYELQGTSGVRRDLLALVRLR